MSYAFGVFLGSNLLELLLPIAQSALGNLKHLRYLLDRVIFL